MYSALFETIGAFVGWVFSGCRGKFTDQLGKEVSYRNSFLGIVVSIVAIFCIIIALRYLRDD